MMWTRIISMYALRCLSLRNQLCHCPPHINSLSLCQTLGPAEARASFALAFVEPDVAMDDSDEDKNNGLDEA